MPQELNLDAFFSPREMMELQAGFYGVPKRERRTMEILKALALDDKADVYARSLSGGMRRRLLVAKALVHSPPVVILDEPTSGLDVPAVAAVEDLVISHFNTGASGVWVSHDDAQARRIARRRLVLENGNAKESML